jgi:hypothetical protein
LIARTIERGRAAAEQVSDPVMLRLPPLESAGSGGVE